MLRRDTVFPFSPLALQASLQTSVFQEINRTTGIAMSVIKQTDVKNHLSARHRTEIHLHQPESQADATGFPREESAGEDPKVSDSVENPLNIPTPSEPETTPIVTKSAKA
jgi:hypothetical protein